MGQLPHDETSTNDLAAHLSRQDGELHTLRKMLEASLADGVTLHGLHDGLEQRVTGVEARLTVVENHNTRVDRAIAVQLTLLDWWERHKARARIAALCGFVSLAFVDNVVRALLHHWGWI